MTEQQIKDLIQARQSDFLGIHIVDTTLKNTKQQAAIKIFWKGKDHETELTQLTGKTTDKDNLNILRDWRHWYGQNKTQ